MGVTCGAGSAYPSGAPEITSSFWWVSCCLVFSFHVVVFVLLVVCFFFFLAMALSVYFRFMSLTVPLIPFAPLLNNKMNINSEMELEHLSENIV